MRRDCRARRIASRLLIFAGVFAAIGLLSAGSAWAGTLELGSLRTTTDINYTSPTFQWYGPMWGGSFDVSTLNGRVLPYVYCVDMERDITLGGTYPYVNLTHDGTIHGEAINNGDQVAWLLQTYGLSATTHDQMAALQCAIWKVISGDKFSLGDENPDELVALYNGYLASIPGTIDSNLVSRFTWISAVSSNGQEQYQGLITTSVPEPSSLFLLAIGLAGVFLAGRRLQN